MSSWPRPPLNPTMLYQRRCQWWVCVQSHPSPHGSVCAGCPSRQHLQHQRDGAVAAALCGAVADALLGVARQTTSDLCPARVSPRSAAFVRCLPLIFSPFSLSPGCVAAVHPPVVVMQHARCAPPGCVSRRAGRGESRPPLPRRIARHCQAQVAGKGGRGGGTLLFLAFLPCPPWAA